MPALKLKPAPADTALGVVAGVCIWLGVGVAVLVVLFGLRAAVGW